LAYLGEKELEDIKLISTHRRNIADFYDESIKNKNIKILFKKTDTEKNNYFRYPILLKSEKIKEDIYDYMKKNNILL
jgi:dTDP-4-amino-4,6-dideoxygalactose transaminase